MSQNLVYFVNLAQLLDHGDVLRHLQLFDDELFFLLMLDFPILIFKLHLKQSLEIVELCLQFLILILE